MNIMAEIENLEKLAEKATEIANSTKKCKVKNAPEVYHFQQQMIDFYLSKARKLRMLTINNYAQ